MTTTKSYIDTSGQLIIDGEPIQVARVPQNLKSRPTRHRKPINQQTYIRSFADAAGSIICLILFATAVALFLSWIKY